MKQEAAGFKICALSRISTNDVTLHVYNPLAHG